MTADGWTRTVRDQLGLGRLLPLGGPRDGAWITEGAATGALRRAVEGVPGVRLGELRLGLTDTADAAEPVVPAPPSALPPGPLRVTADFAATAAEPLPTTAARLREALADAADRGIGLAVAEVDLRVTGLLDEDTAPATPRPEEPRRAGKPTDADETRVAEAVLGVPGVAGLTGALGGVARPVHIEERPGETAALPGRHVRVEIAVEADHRAIAVALAVRARVAEALTDHPTVAVLVTAVG
ncbi:nucleopolyhedrovirus P10 family protein [Streptomyces sp. TRM68416]|uniref:nucleopolyhedrovirus P10 family protein n=1 Tax=Streptomyces sp. TRM68416 TaxID=2758412 RepID=UPI0016619A56|nr:nucleopolyhedrovirus P10 family protein [Streptomyces sp. TRM68416]MBD0842437.1 nucleopolyhedrovirus P10 family protein [Streptomyces sp. TRM68416]